MQVIHFPRLAPLAVVGIVPGHSYGWLICTEQLAGPGALHLDGLSAPMPTKTMPALPSCEAGDTPGQLFFGYWLVSFCSKALAWR